MRAQASGSLWGIPLIRLLTAFADTFTEKDGQNVKRNIAAHHGGRRLGLADGGIRLLRKGQKGRREARSPEGFHEGARGGVRIPGGGSNEQEGASAPSDEAARRMKREILCLQQQMAFLKKVMRLHGKPEEIAMDSAGESFEAIRAALADRNNILTVKDLCELAGVSRSGY